MQLNLLIMQLKSLNKNQTKNTPISDDIKMNDNVVYYKIYFNFFYKFKNYLIIIIQYIIDILGVV